MKKLMLSLVTIAALAACDHNKDTSEDAMEELNDIPEAVEGVIS